MISCPSPIRFLTLLLLFFITHHIARANTAFMVDTCSSNDVCSTAEGIFNVVSDQSYVCIQGCNLNAAPDDIVSMCQMGDFPTVWYVVPVDGEATVMNIEINSVDFESPVISLFTETAGCDQLQQINLSNGNMSCIIGSNGMAKAIGTSISGAQNYYIAVSSLISVGGDFELCVSTISNGSLCVVDRNLTVVARSNGGPLEGPFDPAEKISICMSVNSFTPLNNGCQWFQGIVPVFGNGWDPTSFDAKGQPLNARVNNNQMGSASNGIYGSSTWNWFEDVGYHHDNSRLNIGDFDGNGRNEICNGVYEINCPANGGITGGSGPPCWEDPGDILPPGWFAYGIDGICADPGPPIRVDYGDGNSCSSPMGPWHFCFDLVTRDTPDCLGDSTTKDLSLGFFTFADGETGTWNGDASVCALDQPTKITLKALCGRIHRREPEQLQRLCAGDIFSYQIEEAGISHWEWNISPYWAVPFDVNNGSNGFVIQSEVYNPYDHYQDVTGTLIGHVEGSEDVVIRKINFQIAPCGYLIDILPYEGNEKPIKIDPPSPGSNLSELPILQRSTISFIENQIRVYPIPASERIFVEWPSRDFLLKGPIKLFGSDGTGVEEIVVNPEDGSRKMIDISHLAPGVYFVSVGSSEFRYVSRVIKF